MYFKNGQEVVVTEHYPVIVENKEVTLDIFIFGEIKDLAPGTKGIIIGRLGDHYRVSIENEIFELDSKYLAAAEIWDTPLYHTMREEK